MNNIQLLPVDTWFFRDGSPFTIDSPQVDVGSVFPPHPPTVVGALRAALARRNGWNGRDSWPASVSAVLGEGADLANLSFAGPVLLRDGEPLVPVPSHLLGTIDDKNRWLPKLTLRPGPALCCDLGDGVRLPCPPAESKERATNNAEVTDGWWLTRSGLQKVLEGKLPFPDELVASDCLWTEERRIGLARNRLTRTAEEGMLYSARHVRLEPGVAIGTKISGLPDNWLWPWGELVPFGGESRLSEVAPWSGEPGVPVSDIVLRDLDRNGRLLVIALTPLDLEPKLGADLSFSPDLGEVKIVSACIDRAQRIGGWNFRPRGPLPLRNVVPAGSVLFCMIKNPQRLRQTLVDQMPPQVGSNQAYGYGVVALGTWPDEQEK